MHKVTLFAALFLVACVPKPPEDRVLNEIRTRGSLRVVTINAPTTFFLGAHGAQGFEYELAKRFANELGVTLQIVTVQDRTGLRAALNAGQADIAAAQLSYDANWKRVGLASKAYGSSPLYWIYQLGDQQPHNFAELKKLRIVVTQDSSEATQLQQQYAQGSMPHLILLPSGMGRTPIELVETNRADITLMDGYDYAFAKGLHRNTDIAFALPKPRALNWIIRNDGQDLLRMVDVFLDNERSQGRIPKLQQSMLTPPTRLPMLTARQINTDIKLLLPDLQLFFEEASIQTGIDWRLIAAVAYQESRWNPEAISPDGAQGLMMLMPETAKSLKVINPLDPHESILAGARYVAKIMKQMPSRITEPDRSWFAIASYNMGYGHIEDARVLTQQQGGDPDAWIDVRERLTLLSEEFWYSQTQKGYARGWETKLMVDRTQQYMHLLKLNTADLDQTGVETSAIIRADRQVPAP